MDRASMSGWGPDSEPPGGAPCPSRTRALARGAGRHRDGDPQCGATKRTASLDALAMDAEDTAIVASALITILQEAAK